MSLQKPNSQSSSHAWATPLLLVVAVALGGCSSATDHLNPSGNVQKNLAEHDPEGSGHKGSGTKDEAADSLSPEDQALVDVQKICPVTEEPLGSMGMPIKVVVGDRTVFLCCEGCREELLKTPEEYLAKLDPKK